MNLLTNLMHISDPDQLLKMDIGELHNLPFHIYWKDSDGKYLGCNKTQALAVGLDKEPDLIGCNDFDIHRESYATTYRQNDLSVMSNEKHRIIIEPGVIGGSSMFALSYKMPLRMRTKKKVIGLMGLSFLLNRNDVLSDLLDNSPSGIQLPSTDNIHLSKRQADCLFYVVKGLTLKRIAIKLNLSPKTIEHYLDTVKIKLKCSNRAELIAKGLQLSYIKYRLSLGE